MNNTQTGAEQSSTPIENKPEQVQSLVDQWSHKNKKPYFEPDPKASGKERPRQTFSLEDLEAIRIKSDTIITPRRIVVTIGGIKFASDTNLSVISAAAKSGKSAICNAILAGCLSHDGCIDGFPSIQVLPNHSNKAVLHIDTEQSDEDQQYMVRTIEKRAGKANAPDHFYSYNFRMRDMNTYYDMTEAACRELAKAHGGIHMIVVDGGADFVRSVLDDVESDEAATFFIRLAVRFECPVVTVIHLNPTKTGQEPRERGHLGSIFVRRAYGVFRIVNEGGASKLYPEALRKGDKHDCPDIFFKYSKEHGYHVEVGGVSKKEIKSEKTLIELQEIADDILQGQKALLHTQLVNAIMVKILKGETTAKGKVKELVAHGFIHQGSDKRYRLGSGSERVEKGQD